ncbi:Hint domain-containing protein [Rhodalgimonas zhirmunskyi]|uniref:Hint domain-containing protein n=1 Tax=Rhodalgimonas zhirmunskyi TaxID=2964767 RepID=A0AAJ1X548_9RHOB|nr:Hint domain-containing protein [Rhodoalgimonas zhirmunskyi]MDQ2093799.1 Hint domain-containing protein [Rhodoalgimonas zhirmunskyi]
MGTGFRGTFVIAWSQTELDGLSTAPVQALRAGASWLWHGDVVRVDGPGELLRLEGADGEQRLRRRAAKMVRRLVGAAVANKTRLEEADAQDAPLFDNHFVVTDGTETYTITLIEVAQGQPPLLMFHDEIPPKGRALWIVHQNCERVTQADSPEAAGVICFTPGTRITTPDGPRLIEELREGDQVLTKDNGAQEVLWIGARRMTGARLYAMPKLRPIRFRPGALGVERPDQELIVSPQHRMLVQGDVARALFNTDEVLVQARDLVNGRNIVVDSTLREVTYVHLLLPAHQVVWANNIETESFHPAHTALTTLSDDDRARLLDHFPQFDADPQSYGVPARRNLTSSEAAILMHDAA